MSKYIDVDKLISEIRKLRSESCISESDDYYEYAKSDIIDLINSLQQEQPEEPDKSLEEEVKNYFQGYWPGTETAEQCNADLHFTPPAIIRLARHFAEWGAEHLCDSTKMIDKSPDEAAEEALDDFDANWYIDERDDGCTEPGYNQKQMLLMFKAGAEWMAEHLNK